MYLTRIVIPLVTAILVHDFPMEILEKFSKFLGEACANTAMFHKNWSQGDQSPMFSQAVFKRHFGRDRCHQHQAWLFFTGMLPKRSRFSAAAAQA